ncbi:MAG: hypothetical protein LPK25_17705 [Cyclobacteriaceae bacterium]|nr:hypothetical protein [Cyclobacteriaceae bacterium]MDX5468190.1 hypothetical protein [Cyclobacteriaceae bacterium]
MNKLFSRSALFLGLIIFALPSFSQNFKSSPTAWINDSQESSGDFVILNSGEKISGTIVRNFNQTFYSQIVFESKQSISTYSPGDIQGFGLENGQLFLSGTLPDSEELKFIQIVVSGPLILSSYKDRFFISDLKKTEELKAYYQRTEVNGKEIRKYMRPFIVPLKTFFTGDCGVKLYDRIDKIPFSEFALTRLFKEYFDCLEVEYKVHANESSWVNVSPTLGIGLNNFTLGSPSRLEGRKDRLDQSLGFMGFVGVRFHDFRRLPRFSTEIRFGYSVFKTEVLNSYESSNISWTGSETVKESALYIPWSFNYSVVKNQRMDLYLGILGGFWSPKVTQENGIMDQRFLPSQEVFLTEGPILELQDSKFISGLKLGTTLRTASNFRIFAELEATTQRNYYRFNLMNGFSEYSRNRIAFQVGIEF